MSEFTYEDTCRTPLETFEWDQFWLEHTEDRTSPRVLYIGDSISVPTRAALNGIAAGRMRVDSFATSKAADNPFFAESILSAARQQGHRELILFNNGLHGWHLEDETAYPEKYAAMIRFLKENFPGTPIETVLTTPVANADTAARVCVRNAAVRRIAEEYGCGVTDYHSIPGIADCLSADGVHMTPEGYQKLAAAAWSRAAERLGL